MERSYADAANNHGFKRSRWRDLENMTIQNLFGATVQSIRIFMKHLRKPGGLALEGWAMRQEASKTVSAFFEIIHLLSNWVSSRRSFADECSFTTV